MSTKTCTIAGCSKPFLAKGFCSAHYNAMRTHGDPNYKRSVGGNWRHGHSGTPEHRTWKEIKHRCSNPNAKSYSDYGGRGIKVSALWQNDFPRFFADMGPRPSSKHSIDRIDNDGGYEPGNCRWATKSEQMANRSNNHRVCLDGEWMIVTEAARRLGRDVPHVLRRLDSGEVYRPIPRMRAARKILAPETEAEILRDLRAGARKIDLERRHGITNRHVNDIIRRNEQL